MADFLSIYHTPQIMSVDKPIMSQTPYLEHIIQKQMDDPEITRIKKTNRIRFSYYFRAFCKSQAQRVCCKRRRNDPNR